MQIRVIAKTRAKKQGVTHLTGNTYEVAVSALPVKGAANEAVIEQLRIYFRVKKNQVRLLSGFTSVNKTFEIG